MRYFYILLNVSVAFSLLVLGMAALFSNRKVFLNKLFFLFSLCVGVWMVAAAISNNTQISAEASLFLKYLVFAFSYFSSYLLLLFVILFIKSERALRWFKRISPIGVGIGLLSATPLVVAGVVPQETVYAVEFGPLVSVYALALVGQLGCAIWALYLALKQSRAHRENLQIRVLLYALVASLPVLLATQFVIPIVTGWFEITDLGILTMAVVVISFYLVVIRHGLFDIKLAAFRSVAYLLSVIVLAGVYYILAYAFSALLLPSQVTNGVSVSPVNIVLALALALLFQPIKRFFDRFTDRIFFRNQYSMDDFIARIGEVSTSTTSLRTLLKRASDVVGSTLKASYATFVIYRDQGGYIVLGSGSTPRFVAGEYSILKKELAKDAHDVIAVDVGKDTPFTEIAARYGISLVVPLGGVGYLLLGEQKSGGYKMRDVRALRSIKNELLIAIQNTRSTQEVRELNTHLQQRIDDATRELRSSNRRLRHLDATKDEFMSIASHQLRTPLTSIKGYVSMILDGDLGKVSPAQKKVLKEAFDSSERMVNLISDFLNVSRLQTGKFVIDHVETNLEELVLHEVENLQQGAKSREITLVAKPPKKSLPPLYIDDIKVRQVVMNFIDNALYYTKEKGTVTVSVAQRNGFAEVRVTDTGIGVPLKEQEQLFTKFFRATNAHKRRPDGTGVGLFLAKKVIDGHGGEIIFESKENKGSTFGFRLPISKLNTPPKQ